MRTLPEIPERNIPEFENVLHRRLSGHGVQMRVERRHLPGVGHRVYFPAILASQIVPKPVSETHPEHDISIPGVPLGNIVFAVAAKAL